MNKIDLKKNAPLIFSGVAVVGVFGTAILGVRAGMKADKILAEHEEAVDLKAKMKLTWKCYIFTVATAIATTGCIIASHKLSAKQIAALSSLAAAGTTTLNQYRDKVREIIGAEEEKKLYEEVRAKADWVLYPEVPGYDAVNEEEAKFYDGFSDRYFYIQPSRVQQAIYHVNRNFALKGHQTVNDWYDFLGIDGIDGGDEIAWVDADFYEQGITPWIDVYCQDFPDENGEVVRGIFFDWSPSKNAHDVWL